ncbi:AAA family ATPase [Candidatus Woesearchaeota archaeon]|nr:AAA family ATPase [Candidatus Woesearchaeota archaeon]
MEYTIDKDQWEYAQRINSNKYRSLFSVIKNTVQSAGKKENIKELSDVVNNYSRLFSSAVGCVEGQFKHDSLLNLTGSKDNLLAAYSATIASKTVLNDLESALENNIQTHSQNLEPIKNFDNVSFKWGETSYATVRRALEGVAEYCISSKKNPLESMKEYFVGYSNNVNKKIKSKINNAVYQKIQEIKWKIGPYQVDGLKPIILPKNGKSSKRIEERETEQFYTPFQNLVIEDILSKDRIIGNQKIITDLERMIRCLFLYNKKQGKNPMTAKEKFQQKILIEGKKGEGKGEVCKYLIDYATNINKTLGSNLKVTFFEFESSYVDGSIQKLKSQFKQISNSDTLYLIWQDEIDQILEEKGTGRDSSNTDIIKEFQKFLQGQYINKGNYMILATTNEYLKLKPAIRDRFYPYVWEGAKTQNQKAVLFKYKLEDAIQADYIKLKESELNTLGKIAFDYHVSGREITNICSKVKAEAFRWDDLKQVFDLRNDYQAQLAKIDEINNTVGFQEIKRELAFLIKNKKTAIQDSIDYDSIEGALANGID